jgi:hypothetical protein
MRRIPYVNPHVTLWIPAARLLAPGGAGALGDAIRASGLDCTAPVQMVVGCELLDAGRRAGTLPSPFEALWAGLSATVREGPGEHLRLEGTRRKERVS